MTAKKKKKMIKGSVRAAAPDALNEADAHKFFNLQRVIEATRIQPDKIYNNMKGVYSSLSPEEHKQIATCLMSPVRNFFARLGMHVSFSKLPDNGGQ